MTGDTGDEAMASRGGCGCGHQEADDTGGQGDTGSVVTGITRITGEYSRRIFLYISDI